MRIVYKEKRNLLIILTLLFILSIGFLNWRNKNDFNLKKQNMIAPKRINKKFLIKKTKISSVPPSYDLNNISELKFSPENQHFFISILKTNPLDPRKFTYTPLIDDTPISQLPQANKKWTEKVTPIWEVVFNDTTQGKAYVESLDKDKVVVVQNESVSEEYKNVYSLQYHPLDNYLTYKAQNDQNKWGLVVDGKAQKWYDDIFGIAWFCGKDIYYIAVNKKGKDKPRDEFFIVKNGVEGKKYEHIDNPIPSMSGDCKKILYAVSKNGKSIIMNAADQTETEIFSNPAEKIQYVNVSKDGKRLAYVARDEKKEVEYVVIDGIKQKEYSTRKLEKNYKQKLPFLFKLLLFLGKSKNKNPELIKQTDEEYKVDGIFLSDYGGGAGYSVQHSYIVEDGDYRFQVIYNNETHQKYFKIGDIAMSPNGENIIYVVKKKTFDQATLIKNGQEINLPAQQALSDDEDDDVILDLKYSPDGKHYSYVLPVGLSTVRPGEAKYDLVVDNEVVSEFDYISNMSFSEDGKKIKFGARLDRDIFSVEVQL